MPFPEGTAEARLNEHYVRLLTHELGSLSGKHATLAQPMISRAQSATRAIRNEDAREAISILADLHTTIEMILNDFINIRDAFRGINTIPPLSSEEGFNRRIRIARQALETTENAVRAIAPQGGSTRAFQRLGPQGGPNIFDRQQLEFRRRLGLLGEDFGEGLIPQPLRRTPGQFQYLNPLGQQFGIQYPGGSPPPAGEGWELPDEIISSGAQTQLINRGTQLRQRNVRTQVTDEYLTQTELNALAMERVRLQNQNRPPSSMPPRPQDVPSALYITRAPFVLPIERGATSVSPEEIIARDIRAVAMERMIQRPDFNLPLTGESPLNTFTSQELVAMDRRGVTAARTAEVRAEFGPSRPFYTDFPETPYRFQTQGSPSGPELTTPVQNGIAVRVNGQLYYETVGSHGELLERVAGTRNVLHDRLVIREGQVVYDFPITPLDSARFPRVSQGVTSTTTRIEPTQLTVTTPYVENQQPRRIPGFQLGQQQYNVFQGLQNEFQARLESSFVYNPGQAAPNVLRSIGRPDLAEMADEAIYLTARPITPATRARLNSIDTELRDFLRNPGPMYHSPTLVTRPPVLPMPLGISNPRSGMTGGVLPSVIAAEAADVTLRAVVPNYEGPVQWLNRQGLTPGDLLASMIGRGTFRPNSDLVVGGFSSIIGDEPGSTGGGDYRTQDQVFEDEIRQFLRDTSQQEQPMQQPSQPQLGTPPIMDQQQIPQFGIIPGRPGNPQLQQTPYNPYEQMERAYNPGYDDPPPGLMPPPPPNEIVPGQFARQQGSFPSIPMRDPPFYLEDPNPRSPLRRNEMPLQPRDRSMPDRATILSQLYNNGLIYMAPDGYRLSNGDAPVDSLGNYTLWNMLP